MHTNTHIRGASVSEGRPGLLVVEALRTRPVLPANVDTYLAIEQAPAPEPLRAVATATAADSPAPASWFAKARNCYRYALHLTRTAARPTTEPEGARLVGTDNVRAFARAYVREAVGYTPLRIERHGSAVAVLYRHDVPLAIASNGAVSAVSMRATPRDRRALISSLLDNFFQRVQNRACLYGATQIDIHPAAHHMKRAWVSTMASAVLKQFFAEVDQEALRTVRSLGANESHELLAYLSTGSETKKRRIQAFQAYPALCITAYRSQNWNQFSMVIDDGLPLVKALAGLFNCSEATVRRLRRMTRQKLRNAGHVLRTLDNVPPHLWPVSKKGFEAAAQLPAGITKSRFKGVRHRLGEKSLTPDGIRHLVDALRDLGKLVNGCPMDALRSGSLTGMVKIAEAWRRSMVAEALKQTISAPNDEETAWPATLAEPLNHPNGATIVELTTCRAMTAETIVGEHCVASYIYAVANGHCRIFSIRRGGDYSSTIEVRRAGATFTIEQHRGRRNAQPIPEDIEAAKALIRELKKAKAAEWARFAPPRSKTTINTRAFWSKYLKAGIELLAPGDAPDASLDEGDIEF
jgi:hypothetical protein